MKHFKCIFSYPHGQATADLPAANANAALRNAVKIAGELRVTAIEIWDDDHLVQSRKLWAGPKPRVKREQPAKPERKTRH